MSLRLKFTDCSSGESYPVWPDLMAPQGFVHESATYHIDLVGVDHPLEADLFFDDVEIDPLRPPDSKTARWKWSPGFYSGSVQARIELGRGKRVCFDVTTDPDLQKLTQSQFDLMVQEILEDTFALFAVSSFRKGVAKGSGTQAPPIARLEFLRSRMASLIQAVEAILRNPQRAIRSRQVPTPYYKARQATGPEIARSFRSGRILTERAGQKLLPPELKGFLPEKIIKTDKTSSFDIREHQDVKANLIRWSSWLIQVADLLELKGGDDAETKKLQSVWAGRTRRMALQLRDLLRHDMFSYVSDTVHPTLLTSVYKNIPAYREFYQISSEFRLGIANVFGDYLQLPLARTYDLYELWCFLRMVRAAVEHFGASAQEVANLFSNSSQKGSVVFKTGAIAIKLKTGETLLFQRNFKEFWKEKSKRGSYSRHLRPDIVFAGPNEDSKIIVLDAKYRINSNLNDALSSTHTYRDALVQDEKGGVKGIVHAAYLLSPHIPSFGKDWKKTSMPGRLFHPEYRSEFKFGALTLRPGMTSKEFADVLDLIVKDSRDE